MNRPASPIPPCKLPAYEGPLDLLLHLIRENEEDIYDIPIAEITRQYLDAVALLESLGLATVGEYLVLAATLIEIKSRMLLPQETAANEEEADDPRAELVARLVEYQQFQGTVETLRGWEELRRQLYFRGALENVDDYLLPLPQGEADVQALCRALSRLLSEAGIEEKPITTIVPRRRLSLRLKMAEMLRQILGAGPNGLAFETLFALPCPRLDIVLTFLALLELLRLGKVTARQTEMYATIWLTAIREEANAA